MIREEIPRSKEPASLDAPDVSTPSRSPPVLTPSSRPSSSAFDVRAGEPLPQAGSHDDSDEALGRRGSSTSPGPLPSLPKPHDPPTADDWNAYRGAFTLLYAKQERTLKETMHVLRVEYGFNATERMFKKRVSDWGLRKYHARKPSGSSRDPDASSSATSPSQRLVTSRLLDTPQHIDERPTLLKESSSASLSEDAEKMSMPHLHEDSSRSRAREDEHGQPKRRRATRDRPSAAMSSTSGLPFRAAEASATVAPRKSRFHRSSADPYAASAKSRRAIRRADVVEKPQPWDHAIDQYLKTRHPHLSLTTFRSLSADLEVVESILQHVHQYYDSFDVDKWKRIFPSSPRTVMKEMPLCIELGQSFPVGEAVPLHPTYLFSRYTVAMELLKSTKPEDVNTGWRLVHEAFDLFKSVVAQEHTQLLRYFFQQASDYRFNDHPEIRKRIFEIATEMARVKLGPTHPITRLCYLLPRVAHREEISILAWRKSLEMIDAHLGPSSDESLRSKLAMTGDLIEQSRFDEAESALIRMLHVSDRAPSDYYVRSALIRLAWLYRCQDRHQEAEEVLNKVIERCDEGQAIEGGPPDAIHIAAQTNLAQSLVARGRYREGSNAMADAWQSCSQRYGPGHSYSTAVGNELEKIEATVKSLSLNETHA